MTSTLSYSASIPLDLPFIPLNWARRLRPAEISPHHVTYFVDILSVLITAALNCACDLTYRHVSPWDYPERTGAVPATSRRWSATHRSGRAPLFGQGIKHSQVAAGRGAAVVS